MNMTSFLVMAMAAAAALAVSYWAARSVARRRGQMRALLDRVGELEQRMTAAAESEEPRGNGSGDASAPPSSELSRDVLAGWTSHVGHLLAEEVEATSVAEQAVIFIYRRIGDVLSPSELADELHVSLRSLERGLAGTLGAAPRDLILTVKMREARRMLESGHFKVTDVAHRLAFADAAHFSRRYRVFYRCPPSEHVPPPAQHDKSCGVAV